MAGALAAAVEEMASDYAAFASLDMENELGRIHEAVEDMQLRLEEFSSIVGMQQAKNDKAVTVNVTRFADLRPFVNDLALRVEALDNFIQRVNADLTVLEANMDLAEASYSSESKFSKLNPFALFQKKTSESVLQQPSVINYEPPEIFKKDDYFQPDTVQ
ncbi:biogenesis of lysosome-related organelles complex 1 subunit 4 isoform X1 [Trichogramma pretiosum]|uniref:biogenesis of lysosome-related organelles complex 1 subunit 4 isoform X1 n=1 Tax=Trichogramma pretiosum TaxID=7493 RepID=UPI0006C9A0C5|nr:biogenesis of lysosome-related organelles complex 1 subunit 4 isoform X1 [Trichogramma pretiosum]